MESDHAVRRLRLVEAVLKLPSAHLSRFEQLLTTLTEPPAPPIGPAPAVDWPHAPPHRLSSHGTYIVTAATLGHEHHFRGPERLDHLQATLLELTKEFGWQLEAWAVFSNHYHFVAHAHEKALDLGDLLWRLHGSTSNWVNKQEGVTGRKVWHNFWDTRLTYEASYLARLNYVMQNPVKHGLVPAARLYRWCSTDWFERTAPPAQVSTVLSFKIDRVNVNDDFDPI